MHTPAENIGSRCPENASRNMLLSQWCGKKAVTSMDIAIIEEKVSELAICDADSDVLFESEKAPLTAEEYKKLKALALKSAQDFLALYDSVPDKNATAAPERKTFYGKVPRSADEMYEHTKNVNTYYLRRLLWMPIMTATYTNAASGDLNRLNLTLIFCKIPSEKAAMVRIGPCVKSCAVLSGMTVSTQEPCIEWR